MHCGGSGRSPPQAGDATLASPALGHRSLHAALVLVGLILGALAISIMLAVASGRAVARLRSLYESEQRNHDELARDLRSKTDFTADAPHELRTPLAVILGTAETALASIAVSVPSA